MTNKIYRIGEEPMTEYWITLTFTVEATDKEIALEIARDLRKHGVDGSVYRVLESEITSIEEA